MSETIVAAILSTDHNGDLSNSLDGIPNPSNGDVALVDGVSRKYRYFSASTTTPDGTTVVIPFYTDPGDPGRWFVQGPPTPKLVDGFPGRLNSAVVQERIYDLSVTLEGGAPGESDVNTDLNEFLRVGDAVSACIHGSYASGFPATAGVSVNLLHTGSTIDGLVIVFRAISGNLIAGAYPVRITVKSTL